MRDKVRITFLPFNKKKSFRRGINILEASRELGIGIKASCSGLGKCGECRVIIKKEKTSESEEKLACREAAYEDLTVFIPEESIESKIIVRKGIKLAKGKKQKKAKYGIALDIGTTTLACYLVNEKREIIAEHFSENPQINYGSDVVARLTFSMKKKENIKILRNALIKKINENIEKLAEKAEIEKDKIKEISIVGNTCMRNIFLGYDLTSLARSPFIIKEKEKKEIRSKAEKFGINLEAELYAMPAIESFIGSDTLACIFASGMHESNEMNMLIDIGTNGEVVIGNKDKLLATSCACGPAFEGMHIKHGMPAAKGAIEKVRINKKTGEIKLSIINAKKPLGICGSGIVSAIAELLKVRVIDRSGRIRDKESINLPENLADRLKEKEFVLSFKEENGIKDITITQSDIRSVQLAKAAIASAWKILLKKRGIEKDSLSRVYIAGAFGNYLDKKACIKLGLFPDIELRKIKNLGNAAGKGAIMTLFDNENKKQAVKILNKIEHINLAKEKDFENIFVSSMNLHK